MGQIRGALRAGSVEVKAQAADLLDRILTKKPMLASEFGKAEVALGRHIAELVRAGVPREDAVRYAEEKARMPAAERKVLEQRAATERHDKANDDFLRKKGRTDLFSHAVRDPLFDGEFAMLQRDAYLRTDDLEVSQTVAWDHISAVWGISTVGGPERFIKYPPERFGLPGLDDEDDAEWMTEQLLDFVARSSAFDITKGDLADRIQLVADPQTARELPEPSYVVMLRGNTGALEPMFDADGLPLRWSSDWETSPMRQRLREEAARIVSEAKGERKTIAESFAARRRATAELRGQRKRVEAFSRGQASDVIAAEEEGADLDEARPSGAADALSTTVGGSLELPEGEAGDDEVAMSVLGKIKDAVKFGRRLRDILTGRRPGEVARTGRKKLAGDVDPVTVGEVADVVTTAVRAVNEPRERQGLAPRKKITLTPEQLRAGATDIEAIDGLVRAYQDGAFHLIPIDVVEIDLGPVDAAFAARLKADTGIDVGGFHDAIDVVQIRKALKRHGPGH